MDNFFGAFKFLMMHNTAIGSVGEMRAPNKIQ